MWVEELENAQKNSIVYPELIILIENLGKKDISLDVVVTKCLSTLEEVEKKFISGLESIEKIPGILSTNRKGSTELAAVPA